MSLKPVSLKIEQFYNDEDLEFRITSRKEMRSILQNIAEQGSHVALFYGGGNFILTSLLGASENGMWLDIGPFPPENKRLLLSDKVTFVSVHRHVKVQFTSPGVENDSYDSNEAFYIEMPGYMLRIQRREFFRTSVPATAHVKCLIPVLPQNPDDEPVMREVPVVDISGGGIGLLCEENEDTLLPERVFSDCRMEIPDVGTLIVTLEVRNGINFTTPNNVTHKRVGCHFVDLDNQMNILLQRYITRLQSESMVRE